MAFYYRPRDFRSSLLSPVEQQRAPSSKSALTFFREPLPLRRPQLGAALTAFAEGKLPGAGKYVTSRLGAYDAVIVAANGTEIAAFELIQSFDAEGARFVYLGPLFSRRGAYLPLFAWHVGQLATDNPERPLYLAAEVQSPRALLALHALFPHCAFPRIEDGTVTAEVRAAAAILAEHLGHIEGLDLATLATHADETLYTAQPGCEPVMSWLHQRGIDLARGDNQLVIVRAGASIRERTLLLLQLLLGVESLRPGGEGPRQALAAFQSALRG